MNNRAFEQVFLDVYDRHADAIFRHCFFRIYDRELAREFMQEAFARAWQYLAEGNKVKNVRALIYRIANNLIIDHARKKREVSLEEMQMSGFAPVIQGDTLETHLDAVFLLQQFIKLEEEYRDAVYMRYVDGLKPREIAEITGESVNVISVRIHRGVNKLRAVAKDVARKKDNASICLVKE